ncbi:zinc-finger domain-containing protein [Aquisediminimonas sediminicola]|uniref:zinc-finger domain-containing protein n=1 Tax=Alteraquisediminimonas sediminicola TaxID=2676787 RepID=UPI001C8D382F|nr:zinc-finger domain-containing protein [Aquisediminimonas sediminicola]
MTGTTPVNVSDSSAPETVIVRHSRIACDGASDIPGGAALGHPRIWLQMDESGSVDCPYCDRRFVLADGHTASDH